MKLKGKIALVTGGGSGLGKGIALAFAAEGAEIAICDINEDYLRGAKGELEKLGTDALAVKTDVSSSAEVRALFGQVMGRFGRLDILVNNAGIFRSHPEGVEDRMRHLDLVTTPIKKRSLQITRHMSDEEWETMVKTDLNSVFYCTRAALNIMEDNGYGRIINISSIAGIAGAASHSPNYSAAKAGVVGFTKSVGHEVAGAGVCVNCIAPGYIATEFFPKALERMGTERAARLMQLLPVGRLATVNEIASLAVYLASEDASYMVGQIISPNGGLVV